MSEVEILKKHNSKIFLESVHLDRSRPQIPSTVRVILINREKLRCFDDEHEWSFEWSQTTSTKWHNPKPKPEKPSCLTKMQ